MVHFGQLYFANSTLPSSTLARSHNYDLDYNYNYDYNKKPPSHRTALRRTAQKFRFFFYRDPDMCTFGVIVMSCETPAARSRRGFTRQPENSKRAHLTAPALQTPPKFHERTPKRGRKKDNCGGRGGKSAKCWAPPLGAPPFVSPPSGVPLFPGLGPTLRGPLLEKYIIKMLYLQFCWPRQKEVKFFKEFQKEKMHVVLTGNFCSEFRLEAGNDVPATFGLLAPGGWVRSCV